MMKPFFDLLCLPEFRPRLFHVGIGLAAFSVCAFAGEIRVGARMHVKGSAMWFGDNTNLRAWQILQERFTPAGLESYRDAILSSRSAWQFDTPKEVKILTYWPGEHEVNVEMILPGKEKWNGNRWWVDDKDLMAIEERLSRLQFPISCGSNSRNGRGMIDCGS
jgi:hypothetical protein